MAKKGTTAEARAWTGRKSALLTIRVTPKEKEEVTRAAEETGGLGVSRYLLNLHHREVGNLKKV